VEKLFLTFISDEYYSSTLISYVKLVSHMNHWETWESAVSQKNGRCRLYFYMYLPFILTTFLIAEKCIEINFAKEENKLQNIKLKKLWREYFSLLSKEYYSSTFILVWNLYHKESIGILGRKGECSAVFQVNGMCSVLVRKNLPRIFSLFIYRRKNLDFYFVEKKIFYFLVKEIILGCF